MANQLHGKRVAVVATDGFEQSELADPVNALKAAGAVVEVVAPKAHHIQGMRHHDKGDTVAVDRTIDAVRASEFDALVLPGGVANPDALRTNPLVVAFVRRFFEDGKPVAALCHGGRGGGDAAGWAGAVV